MASASWGWKSNPEPLVSQVKRLSQRKSHGILRPAMEVAGQSAHLGNDSGRGGGSLPGQCPRAQQVYSWDPWKRETLPFKALLVILAVIENQFFLDQFKSKDRFLKLRISKCNNFSFGLLVWTFIFSFRCFLKNKYFKWLSNNSRYLLRQNTIFLFCSFAFIQLLGASLVR